MSEPLASIESCTDRLLTKFSAFNAAYSSSLENQLKQVLKLQKELLQDTDGECELSVTAVVIWEQCVKKLKDILRQMATEHREMHSGVSKCGKEIDKTLVSDFSNVFRKQECYEATPELKTKVNALLVEHLLTQGALDVAETLSRESGVELDERSKASFSEMNDILEALKAKDLQPALKWAESNSASLLARGSSLEFQLHRLHFIQLLKSGAANDAVAYSRTFQKFAAKHQSDIRELMGALLWTGETSTPYSHLFDDVHWATLADAFTRDACLLYGLPVESPLSVILNAGCVALPPLISLRQMMTAKKVVAIGWGQSDELPVEIDLGENRRYHSVFACPILRQQTTEANPPMRLSCGHVISHDALNKLASNNSFRLKCPYCPTESLVADAKRVFF